MAYMVGVGRCWGCGQHFAFNCDRVPSLRVKGEREPICLDCVNRANTLRAEKGLEPIVPLPGAYEPEECP